MSGMGGFHGRPRTVAAAGAASAAVLALVSSYVPLYTVELGVFDDAEGQVMLSLNTWSIESNTASLDPTVSMPVVATGYPIVFAAGLLVAAALLVALSTSARPARLRAGAVGTAAGAAFLAGVGWVVGMQIAGFAKLFAPDSDIPSPIPASVGPGVWLLGTAVLLAVAAAVAAWLRTREPEPARPAEDEAATPPFGIPVVRLEEPQAGPDRPLSR